jgi:hypothetical protein
LARVTNIRAGSCAGFEFLELDDKPREAVKRLIGLLGAAAKTTQTETSKADQVGVRSSR